MKDFINQIELAKEYCAENKMILVKILIPRELSEELTKLYKPLYAETTLPQKNAFEGIPVYIRDDIKKPQFVFEVA